MLCDCMLVMPTLVITEQHFFKLKVKPTEKPRSAAIVVECSMASYVFRLTYGMAVNDDGPDTRQIAAVALVASSGISAGLQIVESSII